MDSMKNHKETSIYVIDADYHLVYFNNRLQQAFPNVQCGDLCYRALCQEDSPCITCPLAGKTKDRMIYYNKALQYWVEVSTGMIEWPGAGSCSILLAKQIDEGNKNLFYNLTNISSYDELFELNPSQNIYNTLYHREGKFVSPARSGKLRDILLHSAAHMVHPDDRDAFLQFWNLDTLLTRLIHAETNHSLLGEFRKLTLSGEYRWVTQTVVPIAGNAYGDDVLMCFVQDIHDQKHDSSIDPLTGLYQRTAFYNQAHSFLAESDADSYCLMVIDIEHFKLFNEWYGTKAGDDFLYHIGQLLQQAQRNYHGLAGYIGDDDFAIILPDSHEILTSLSQELIKYVQQYEGSAGFLPAFGIYRIDDKALPVNSMYDRAAMALSSVKGNYAHRTSWYDTEIMQKMERNHVLLSEVQRALDNQEFLFYAQPKCNLSTGKIIGLESLIRWQHPERGLIPPGEFIPLLEQNGFISNLDLYIWEKVCQSVRNWLDHGRRAIPISVNVSRVDIYTLDVVEIFQRLVAKYRLDPVLIEIEITESAYVEEYNIITSVVEKLRGAGFTVLMDDFGSGYSSLNMLKDVNVDIIKLDMKFLDMNEQSAGKGLGILEAIANMARMMGLRIIAEGVETKEQIDLLLNMGCIYGQGYYFYRPLPIKDFEALLADENNIDFRGISAKQLERLQVKELLNGDLFSDSLMNNILGGIAFYDVHDDVVELLRVNEQYYKVTQTNPVDLAAQNGLIIDEIYHTDIDILLDIFKQAQQNPLTGHAGDIRRLTGKGSTIWLHLHAFFLKEQDGHKLFYGSVSDVTSQRLREQQLASSQRALSAVVHIAENDQAFMKLTEENRRTAASIFAQITPSGMIGGYCDKDFSLYFANHEMVKLLGYESYTEFEEAIEGKVINTIHPEDRPRVMKELGSSYYAGQEYTISYRMPRKDGSWFWTLDKGKVIQAEDGRLAIVSACTDISEPMMVQQQLMEENANLHRQNEALNFINNDFPGGYHRCSTGPGYRFLYVSNRFLELLGYTRQELTDLFDDLYLNLVHPDDRDMVIHGVVDIQADVTSYNLEYRILSKRGYIKVIDQSKYMELGSTSFIQGVILDVTDTVELRNKMQLLMEHIPENIGVLSYADGTFQYTAITNGLYKIHGCMKHTSSSFQHTECLPQACREAIMKRQNYQEVLLLHPAESHTIGINLDARFIGENSDGIHYLVIYSDVTPIKQKEHELWLAGQQLEIIHRLANINGWDWNVKEDTLTLYNVSPPGKLAEFYKVLGEKISVIHNFTELLKKTPAISASYLEPLLSCVEQMHKGIAPSMQEDTEIPLRAPDGNTYWIKSACESIYDNHGKIIKAVGYYTDITDQKNEIIQNRESMRAIDFLMHQSLYSFKINLTENTMLLEKNSSDWVSETGCAANGSYTDIISYIGHNLILPEYQESYLDFMNKERLLASFQNGNYVDDMEYQRLYQGKPRWIKLIIHLVQYENLSDINAFLFILDIDEVKKQELHLTQMAETDALTGLYNRQTAIPKINEYLSQNPEAPAALIMFDLDNFKLANDVFGHDYGDSVIHETAMKLRKVFREKDIFCRIGGDEFMVFCTNMLDDNVSSRLKQVLKEVHIVRSFQDQEIVFSISAGYAIVPEHGNTFDTLYQKADIALFTAKMNGKNSSLKYQPTMKAIRYELANQHPL